jgi:catechol 2,3-dioxygenase-like lactoylglutathione lyase family enzyme
MEPLDPRVEIGRVRLRVGDLDRALSFYAGILGFEVAHRRGGLFALLGAGGFAPHIGLYAGEVPGEASTSDRFAIRYPDRVALGHALLRLEHGRIRLDRAIDDGVSESLYVRDPDDHVVELYCDHVRTERGGAAFPLSETAADVNLESLRLAAAQSSSAKESGPAMPAALSDASRQRLRDLRARLLHLHKVLLDDTRAAYELDRGRVGSNASLLQLVISDPWFAWLHSLSEMVVRIDETVEQGSPATQSDATALLDQVERLLTASESGDGFARRYYEALQRQPAVVLAHADVRRTLKSMR